MSENTVCPLEMGEEEYRCFQKAGWYYVLYEIAVSSEDPFPTAKDAMGAADTWLAKLTMEKAATAYLSGPVGGSVQ